MKSPAHYLNSQKGKVSEGIKKAILARIPIVYIVTDEISLIFDILREDRIIEVAYNPDDKAARTNILFSEAELNGWMDHPDRPIISVLFVPLFEGSQTQELSVKNTLFRFVQVFQKSRPIPKDDVKSLEGSTVLVVTPSMPSIPSAIVPYSRVIKVPPIQGDELWEVISEFVKELDGDRLDANNLIADHAYLQKIANNLRGLSRSKIREIFVTLKDELGFVHVDASRKEQMDAIIRIIQKEKELLIENSGILKMEKPADDIDPSTMENLFTWLQKSTGVMIDPGRAKSFAGLRPMKGAIMSGIPGSGKSLMAKVVASTFGLPLISMSMGLLMGKHLGESEHRLEEALRIIEALSPCVVWIDEIEKDMSGTGNGESDGGTARRMFAQFLKWMQEKETRGVSCFVFATANDISNLPSELLRSGRFDAKFYTFMPSLQECDSIFQSLIDKQRVFFDESMVSSNKGVFKPGFFQEILEEYHRKNDDTSCCKFLTGADIESLIEMAKKNLYYQYCKDNDSEDTHVAHLVYRRQLFKKEIEDCLDSIRSYGETNMRDIASCFIQLARESFYPAGNSLFPTSLVDFEANTLKELKVPLSKYDTHFYDRLKKYVSEELESQNELRKRGITR